MQGFYAVQQGHWVNVLPAVDAIGGAVGDRFSMAKWAHASILVVLGISESAPTALIVKECTAATGGTATAIDFKYHREEAAAGDTFGAKETNGDTSGIDDLSANDNIMYGIELDARELSDGYPWVEVSFTNGSNPCLASIVALLSGGRHQYDQGATVLA